MEDEYIKILVFSDDVDTRKAVTQGVGLRPAKNLPMIEWVETATGQATVDAVTCHDFSLLILDGEAAKEGGMGIARQLQTIIPHLPPIIILTARPQDEWLARWAGAAAVVPEPINPIDLQEKVSEILSTRS